MGGEKKNSCRFRWCFGLFWFWGRRSNPAHWALTPVTVTELMSCTASRSPSNNFQPIKTEWYQTVMTTAREFVCQTKIKACTSSDLLVLERKCPLLSATGVFLSQVQNKHLLPLSWHASHLHEVIIYEYTELVSLKRLIKSFGWCIFNVSSPEN